MSSEDAIRVSNLSKCYQIYDSPRDRLKQFFYPRIRRVAGRGPRSYFREFWALKDVSFEVGKGETIGVIGRNGSGKSTLLQLICGTLSPTSGSVDTNGRIAALLELGSGFNPEFTGRENVYMNGAVLGLRQDEIDARFDQIASFADIGQFMEQPVKTYSSGMFVRLAFAVAVHVAPDILIVDEALSVGDIAFRNKCMLRIREMHDRGTSILFVSHDMSTLQLICNRVIWINDGKIIAEGDPTSVCQEYYVAMTGSISGTDESINKTIQQQDTGMAHFLHFDIESWETARGPSFTLGQDIRFRFKLKALADLEPCIFAISIYRDDGDWLIGQTSREESVVWTKLVAGGCHNGSFVLSPNCLAPGEYLAALGAYSYDHSICYALTDLSIGFSVRSDFPIWGKFYHPSRWIDENV